ncbi:MULTISPECIES: alternative ribosome rescue aminoacyl-tRNA hydrolase ArfB [Pedobacter]|uniref:alternative ribosome rescue aminoacyl-tRNA hydrolase ArfB n=1 Tax=Pedobacter TaxID=84567 RepID=UPI00210D1D37|nr:MULTISPECIES: alternative ribosome rescue aminoacyl-tRNA hydrolase ArfB [unclassified Pedobacter]
MIPAKEDILKVAVFRTSRSGGKGGQNVNKVSSKVELLFHPDSAPFLTDEEKSLLRERLAGRIDAEGYLHVVSQEDRSQLMNKERTVLKLIDLLRKSLHVDKLRKPTKTPKAVIRKRLENKKIQAQKKEGRRRPEW